MISTAAILIAFYALACALLVGLWWVERGDNETRRKADRLAEKLFRDWRNRHDL